MHNLTPSVLATFALLVSLMVAGPTATASTILPRTQYCSNAPTVVAGSVYTPHLLNLRGNPVRSYWCAPNSSTYIVLIDQLIPIAGSQVFRLLINLIAHLDRTLSSFEDGLVMGGEYVWGREQAYCVRIRNANNHQCTYGVMRAAVAALYDYMLTEHEFGTVKFDIWDGENEVGQGTVESTGPSAKLL